MYIVHISGYETSNTRDGPGTCNTDCDCPLCAPYCSHAGFCQTDDAHGRRLIKEEECEPCKPLSEKIYFGFDSDRSSGCTWLPLKLFLSSEHASVGIYIILHLVILDWYNQVWSGEDCEITGEKSDNGGVTIHLLEIQWFSWGFRFELCKWLWLSSLCSLLQ